LDRKIMYFHAKMIFNENFYIMTLVGSGYIHSIVTLDATKHFAQYSAISKPPTKFVCECEACTMPLLEY
jgi:hypothetical protein